MSEVKIFLKGKLRGKFSSLGEKLANLGFTRIEQKSKKLIVEKIEGESLKGKPYLYTRFTFLPNGIEIEYSVPPEVNAKKRNIDACRLVLDTIVLADCYSLNTRPLYKLIAQSLADSLEFVTTDYELLKNKLDSQAEEYRKLAKKYADVFSLNEKNSKLLLEVEKVNEALKERVRKLEGMSDETLCEELFEWIKAHNGNIDVLTFARQFNLTPARVEEGLDKLMKEGYIGKA